MLAVVKKHLTKQLLFEVRGSIPMKVMEYLKQEFGQDVELLEDGEEMVNIFDSNWYKEISTATTSGDVLRIYRENAGLSQEALGKKIGKLSRQKISDMERGKRNISKEMAKKLSLFFNVPVQRFL